MQSGLYRQFSSARSVCVSLKTPDCALAASEKIGNRKRVQSSCREVLKGSKRAQRFSTKAINMTTAVEKAERQRLIFNNVASAGLHTDRTRDSTVTEKFVLRKVGSSSNQDANTVVIIMGFYGATEKAINMYCNLYHDFGFDAVYVPSYLKHFAWPNNSLELANDLLNFVTQTCAKYENIVIHAFSMGAYNFTVCIAEMYSKPELYADIENKIKAVVYDSLTIGTLQNMINGVGQGVSKNRIVRTLVPASMSLYFKLTNKYTVQVYDHYINIFKQKPLLVPTLLFYCKNDPMSDYTVIEMMLQDWKKRFSIHTVSKWWAESKHSAHLLCHKEEYTDTLNKFLKDVPGLMKIDSKI